jgi:hypothetical protein
MCMYVVNDNENKHKQVEKIQNLNSWELLFLYKIALYNFFWDTFFALFYDSHANIRKYCDRVAFLGQTVLHRIRNHNWGDKEKRSEWLIDAHE